MVRIWGQWFISGRVLGPSSPSYHKDKSCTLDFPGSSFFLVVLSSLVALESACSAGDPGSIPGWRRSPGEGNGNPLQYSCLENPMDRGSWQTTVYGVTRVGHHLVTEPPTLWEWLPQPCQGFQKSRLSWHSERRIWTWRLDVSIGPEWKVGSDGHRWQEAVQTSRWSSAAKEGAIQARIPAWLPGPICVVESGAWGREKDPDSLDLAIACQDPWSLGKTLLSETLGLTDWLSRWGFDYPPTSRPHCTPERKSGLEL